jgi:hypothetical protein
VLTYAVLDASLVIVRAQGRRFLGAFLDTARARNTDFGRIPGHSACKGTKFFPASMAILCEQGRNF